MTFQGIQCQILRVVLRVVPALLKMTWLKSVFFMARKVTFGQKRKKATYLFLHILNFAVKKSGRSVEMRVSYHLVLFLKICYCFFIQNTAAYSKMQIWVEQSYWAKTQQIHEKHTATYCHMFMDVVPSYAEISFVNFIRVLTSFFFSFLTY